MKIPITKPCIDEGDKQYVLKPFETGWLVQGPYVADFEKKFAEYIGCRYARAVSSCTTALHLALEVVGVGPGDKVLVPSFTYVASANAVEYTGAEVVLCDIELKSFNIDLKQAERILAGGNGTRIKAIMPVNLFGLCSDLPGVMALASKYGLKVVEDSACGLGAWIGGKHSGTFGNAGCFSFHPRKSITTGEGGMVTTDDGNLAGRISELRDHGASKSDLARHGSKSGGLLPGFSVRGYNYRMTDFQGALGVSQMGKVDYILGKRRELARKYDTVLGNLENFITPNVPEGYIHGYQSYVCVYRGSAKLEDLSVESIDALSEKRDAIMARLEERGVTTRQGTHTVHNLEYYRVKYGFNPGDFINAYAADRLSISLPLYPAMTDEEFNYVVTEVKDSLEKTRSK